MTNIKNSQGKKLWQRFGFWEIVVGIVSVIITLAIFRLQQQSKGISYEILSNSPLLSVKEELESDIEISYKGKEIENAQMIILRITNSGNLPIPSADYEGPITINMHGEILNAEITKAVPTHLPAKIDSVTANAHSSVKLAPVLLNPGNSITLKTILTNLKGDVSLTSQIVGAEIQEKPPSMADEIRQNRISILYILLAFTLGVMMGGFVLRVLRGIYGPINQRS